MFTIFIKPLFCWSERYLYDSIRKGEQAYERHKQIFTHDNCICFVINSYPDGQILGERFIDGARHTAVVERVDTGERAQQVHEGLGGDLVTPHTPQAQYTRQHLQDLSLV